MLQGRVTNVAVLPLTRAWWQAVSAMPHCRLWAALDWQFAITTALVADMAYRGSNAAATELRNRERVLGTTVEYRRDLRIRYVDGPDEEPERPEVTVLDDYREL